eukprot:GILK01006370.1.p1 GENE.GILK01006370.1~~GILK01006370.1.p1  ORF type:complete len:443 (-),score=55.12 GILK01006370.1:110-1438(-)
METQHLTDEEAEVCVPRASEASSRRSSYVFEPVSHLLDENGDIRPLRAMRQEPISFVPSYVESHPQTSAFGMRNIGRLSSSLNSYFAPHAMSRPSLRPPPISAWNSMGNSVGDDWPIAGPPQAQVQADADADADEDDEVEDAEEEDYYEYQEDEESSGHNDREHEEEGEEDDGEVELEVVNTEDYHTAHRRPLYTGQHEDIDGDEFLQQEDDDDERNEEEEEYVYDEESSEGETVSRRQRIPEEWSREVDECGGLTDVILDRCGLLGLLMHCRFRKSGLFLGDEELDFLGGIVEICYFITGHDTTKFVATWRELRELLPPLSQVGKLISNHAHTSQELAVCKLVLTMFQTYYSKVDFPLFKIYTNDLLPLFLKFYEALSEDTVSALDSELTSFLSSYIDMVTGKCDWCIFLPSRQDYLDHYRAQIRQYRNMVEGISLKSIIN